MRAEVPHRYSPPSGGNGETVASSGELFASRKRAKRGAQRVTENAGAHRSRAPQLTPARARERTDVIS
jgi:Domain of unknown function (DUF1508)